MAPGRQLACLVAGLFVLPSVPAFLHAFLPDCLPGCLPAVLPCLLACLAWAPWLQCLLQLSVALRPFRSGWPTHRCSLKLIYCHPHSCHGPCHLRCCHRRCCAPCQMCSECFKRRHGCSSPAALSCLLSTHWRSRWGPAGWRPAACEPAWAPYCGPKRGTAQGTHKPWLLVLMSLCLHLPPCPPAAAACLAAGPAAAAPRPVCAEPAAAGTGGQLPSDSGPPPPHPSHPRLWQQQRRRQPRDSHALCCRRRRPDWSPCGRHCSQGSCGAR